MSFAGKSMFYGNPLRYSCSNGPTKMSERKNRLSDALVLVIIIIDTAAGVGIILTVGWCCYIRWKNITGARTETAALIIGKPEKEKRRWWCLKGVRVSLRWMIY